MFDYKLELEQETEYLAIKIKKPLIYSILNLVIRIDGYDIIEKYNSIVFVQNNMIIYKFNSQIYQDSEIIVKFYVNSSDMDKLKDEFDVEIYNMF